MVLHVAEFIYLLLILTIAFSKAAFHKQSCDVVGKYKVCSLEQEEICHPFKKADGVKINSLESSAVIVKSYLPISHGTQLITNKECTFTIKTKDKEDGLFAVIQDLNFRKNEEGCVDYVQFKKEKGPWSQKFCDEMDRKTNESEIPHQFYSEYDPRGNLETRIFISQEPIKQNEHLRITIVYTPYTRCSKLDRKNYREVTPEFCIWKDYICDNYQNCAIKDCDDEIECVRSLENDGTGTKVTIGAVTTIFLVFIIFVTCLWICKKHQKLCWSPDCAGPGVTRPSLTSETERVTASSAPTAPMLEIAVPAGIASGKDLPPSYDSLFPEQSNTTST